MPSSGGFLYAIGAEGTTLVKIGYTKSVEKRIQILQAGHPLPLRLLATVPLQGDMRRVEQQVHAFLAAERRRGEWFAVAIDDEQLAALVARAIASLEAQDATNILGAPVGAPAEVFPSMRAKRGRKRVSIRKRPRSFGQRLQLEREKRGWTQQALARLAAVRQCLISELEAGKKTDTTGNVLKRFALVFGVSADYLVGMYDDDTPEEEGAA